MSEYQKLSNEELTERLLVATRQRNHGRNLGTSDWGLWQMEVDALEIEVARRVKSAK